MKYARAGCFLFFATPHIHISRCPSGNAEEGEVGCPRLPEAAGFLLHNVKPFPSVRRLHAFASCLPWIAIASCCVFRVSCALCLPCKSSGTARIIGIQHVTRHKVRKDVRACFLEALRALPCPALSCTNQPFVGYRKLPRCSEEEGREGGDGKTVPFFVDEGGGGGGKETEGPTVGQTVERERERGRAEKHKPPHNVADHPCPYIHAFSLPAPPAAWCE